MEPNNQSQPLNNIGVPSATPAPEPVAPIIPAFDLSVMLTPPPRTDALGSVSVPVMVVPEEVPQIPLHEQVLLLEKDIVLLDQKRESLEVETGVLSSEQKEIEDSLAPVTTEEEGLRALLKEIEAREMSATTKADKRNAEQERWEQEQKRRTVELTKLEIKERIEKILNAITGKEILHQSIVDEEALLKKKIHALEVEQKRIELNVKLRLIAQKRGEAELNLAEITKEKLRIAALLQETGVKEKTIEGSEHDTEQKMTIAQTFKEERALAEARATLEKERHGIEEARWKAEDQADALGLSALDAEKTLEDFKKQEAALVEKLKEFK